MKDFEFDENEPDVRICDHPDCEEMGEFRAPRSRSDLRNYLWFCLAHVLRGRAARPSDDEE